VGPPPIGSMAHPIITKMAADINSVTMDYLDNLDNKSLNKYEKNLKNRKKNIDMFLYL
jgi:hypothetical protein